MPMHVPRQLGEPDENLFDPLMRRLCFEDQDLAPMHMVVTMLRLAWAIDPDTALSIIIPKDNPPTSIEPPAVEENTREFLGWAQWIIGPFMRHAWSLELEQRDALKRNEDMMDLESLWRRGVKSMWAMVFGDVGAFVNQAFYDHGHYHMPSNSLLPLDFPTTATYEKFTVHRKPVPGSEAQTPAPVKVTTKFDTNVLICPAYLAPGVEIRVTRTRPSSTEEREIGVFDLKGDNRYEVWYLRRDTEWNFYVEAEEGNRKGGERAAVMVLGTLCREYHGE